MKRLVARLTAPKTIQINSETVAEPGPHEMVVRMVAAGICRSELPTFLGEASMVQKGPFGFPCIIDSVAYPAVFGHEPAGIVERVGSEVTRFAPGDRVSGACGGAFASHVTVSEFAPFVKVPESVDLKSCLAEPVMCCCNIVHAAGALENAKIAVVGCGYMGLITISLLRAYGAKNITAFDIDPARLEKAAAAGAHAVFDASDPDAAAEAMAKTGNAGFDRVVELSAGLKGLALAVSLIRRPDESGRGVIIASSVYDKSEPWPAALGFELVCRCPELHFVHPGYALDVPALMKEGVEAYASGALPEGGFITHRFAPEEMGRAYEMMLNGDAGYMKGAVMFE